VGFTWDIYIKRKFGRVNDEISSFGLLADSIHKFSEIYEKIEYRKKMAADGGAREDENGFS
jgi:hypothetical protein